MALSLPREGPPCRDHLGLGGAGPPPLVGGLAGVPGKFHRKIFRAFLQRDLGSWRPCLWTQQWSREVPVSGPLSLGPQEPRATSHRGSLGFCLPYPIPVCAAGSCSATQAAVAPRVQATPAMETGPRAGEGGAHSLAAAAISWALGELPPPPHLCPLQGEKWCQLRPGEVSHWGLRGPDATASRATEEIHRHACEAWGPLALLTPSLPSVPTNCRPAPAEGLSGVSDTEERESGHLDPCSWDS